jgi:hypothetical protein
MLFPDLRVHPLTVGSGLAESRSGGGFVAGYGFGEGMLYGTTAPHDSAAIDELNGAPEFRGTAILAGNGVRHRLRPDIDNVPICHVELLEKKLYLSVAVG